MSRFNTAGTRQLRGAGPVETEAVRVRTAEGGLGYARDARSELFLLAVTHLGHRTFYRTAEQRDERFETLLAQVATADPTWAASLLGWLRSSGYLRYAPLVGAAVFASLGLPGRRQVVDSVLQRADEPGEFVALWRSRYGTTLPAGVQRGVADAVVRLYSEFSALKYDTASHPYRFADVIALSHPAKSPDQAELFRWLWDRRNGWDNPPYELPMVALRRELETVPAAERRAMLASPLFPARLRAAGGTWQWLSSWLNGPMDAAAWEAAIPGMGYQALLMNLRNFDQAGVSDRVAEQVVARLTDPVQVARSRQLPLAFLSAYRAVPSDRWGHSLSAALELALANIPKVGGRTLILVDTSSSMDAPLSADSELHRWDAAAVFGLALSRRCANADVVSFSSNQRYYSDRPGARTKVFSAKAGESLLRSVRRWDEDGYFLGGGTDTEGALAQHFAGHDRVVILTDEQASREVGRVIPNAPFYTWNLAGEQVAHAAAGAGRVTFGGLSDAGFVAIDLIERGRSARWPWETAAR